MSGGANGGGGVSGCESSFPHGHDYSTDIFQDCGKVQKSKTA
jgi:hypothetical protein